MLFNHLKAQKDKSIASFKSTLPAAAANQSKDVVDSSLLVNLASEQNAYMLNEIRIRDQLLLSEKNENEAIKKKM